MSDDRRADDGSPDENDAETLDGEEGAPEGRGADGVALADAENDGSVTAEDAVPDSHGSHDGHDERPASAPATVGEYDWEAFEAEFFYEDGDPPTNWRGQPRSFDPAEYLGSDPDETGERVEAAAETAAGLSAYFEDFLDPEETQVALGEYLWEHFRYEYYYDEPGGVDETGNVDDTEKGSGVEGRLAFPRDDGGEIVAFDRSEWLGHDDLPASVFEGGLAVTDLSAGFEAWLDPATTPVTKGEYYWEHFKYEYYYADTDVTAPERPRDDEGEVEQFGKAEWLGFPEEDVEERLAEAAHDARKLREIEEERTLDVPEELDEDAFFSTVEGHTTLVNRYDLEKAVALPQKRHFRETDRYWVNKPYSFVVIFHSAKENETKYYLVEPYCTPIEDDLKEFLTGKLRSSIKYSSEDVVVEAAAEERADVIENETLELLARYNLYAENDGERAERLRELLDRYDGTRDAIAAYVERLREETDAATEPLRDALERRRNGSSDADESDAADGSDTADASSDDAAVESTPEAGDATDDDPSATAASDDDDPRIRLDEYLDLDFEAGGSLPEQLRAALEAKVEELEPDESGGLDGITVRPEPVLLEEDDEALSEYQTEKLLYYLRRDFVGYERIDGIKHDINVEDISCDGYDSPVFVYHTDYEQVITNVHHGEDELDDFVVKMAQRSGKGISKRQPQVDATLPDGSRAQLTLGREVSDHGTNYTIRQFKDVPFTPVDLVNWNTFSLEEMAFLWLAIENHKSLIFAGGTASGKTTSLNAVSLFIPSNSKIVSIEDTREVELPQRNWIASVTRPSFSDDDTGDVDEFDLLEAALRQRPDYIVMGEIRGEEGRTLFQVMSTGHTTYTTFHADTVGEVLKRFTTEPINVSKTLFTALDLVSIQTQTRVQGSKVRRNKSLTEINEYNAENDEINVQDVFQWRAEDDEFMRLSGSNTMEEIMFDRGWSRDRLEREILKRRVILAYLIESGLNEYTQVAATVQAFINDPETILTLVANGKLEESLQDLREMESVQIDVDPKKEEMVPRPDPSEETYELAKGILAEAEDRLLEDYRGADADAEGLAVALAETAEPTDAPAEVEAESGTAPDSDSDSIDSEPRPGSDSESRPDADPDAGSGSDSGRSSASRSVSRPDADRDDTDRDASVGDALDSESAERDRVRDTESVGPEDSVRNVSDAGELGSFPEAYDEVESESDGGERSEAESDGGERSEADESFGDFEAAFEAEKGDVDADADERRPPDERRESDGEGDAT